jgi:glycosyltransferase involved in cell wall biosynthesis
MISEFGLSGRVVLCTDALPRSEVPLLYRSFDVFVLPTRREGFGMVFAEAMAMGVPVVGPEMEPVTEVVRPGCGILVKPEDVGQYCGALSKLLRDSAFRHEMGQRAREHALKTWGGEAAADRVIEVYCDLIRSRGLAAGAAA